ncbi:MAG: LPS assembly lipoprotein LptE [Gammaproteobacteria bacterium]|nr:LPS assembly lipoprotein LptE [Gammaproteobacteria bacterium]
MHVPHLVVLSLLLALASCGFQLRGDYDLPPLLERVVLTGPQFLRDELMVGLRASDVEVVDSRDDATAIVTLDRERFSERVLSVDPNTGRSREFEVAYAINFKVDAADGSAIAPNQTIVLQRDYVFDEDAIIGKSRERGVLREEMRRDAAQQILLRLQGLDRD